MMIKFFCITIISLSIFSSIAQSDGGKRIQGGLTANAGFNLISPGLLKKFNKDGSNSNVGIGFIFNSSFKGSSTLGISSGLEFDFDGARFQTEDSIFYDFTSNQILTESNSGDKEGTFYLQSRNQKTIYATVPLMLLFRTENVGDFRYFAKFGLRNSILIRSSMNDEGVNVTDPAQHIANDENLKFESPGEVFLFRSAVGISGGAEWRFLESTGLALEFGYFYGITPLYLDRKPENKTLYEYNDANQKVYLSNKATQNQFIFKLSLLF